jgi:hypothetical protein
MDFWIVFAQCSYIFRLTPKSSTLFGVSLLRDSVSTGLFSYVFFFQ